jgi:hypothetical protein
MSVEPRTFGPFRLNPENGTLFRDGVLVPIGQKGALILAALSTSVGEVLTKTQLVDAAWPGMAVEESNLSVQIAALRKALGMAEPSGLSPSVNGRWSLTETLPTLTRQLACICFISIGARRPRPMSKKLSVSVHAMRSLLVGWR